MKPILRYFSTQLAKTRTVRAKPFITCSLLLILTLGVGELMGTSLSSNEIANAQLEDTEEIREEQRARTIEEEFPSEQGQDQDDKEDDTTVSAIMEVYAENQTLLRTSSLPEPIVIDDDSEGTILQLATTLDDNPALQNITARALVTDSLKVNPLSDTIEANMGLGEIKSATS